MRRPPAAVTACCGRPARTTKQVAGGRRRDAASGSCHSTARAASSQRGEETGGRRDAASDGCHNSVRAATAWTRWLAGAPCELRASKSATVRAGSEFAVDPRRLAVQQCCGVYCCLGARDAAVLSREDSTPVDSLRAGYSRPLYMPVGHVQRVSSPCLYAGYFAKYPRRSPEMRLPSPREVTPTARYLRRRRRPQLRCTTASAPGDDPLAARIPHARTVSSNSPSVPHTGVCICFPQPPSCPRFSSCSPPPWPWRPVVRWP
jgi:hypothetical protein